MAITSERHEALLLEESLELLKRGEREQLDKIARSQFFTWQNLKRLVEIVLSPIAKSG